MWVVGACSSACSSTAGPSPSSDSGSQHVGMEPARGRQGQAGRCLASPRWVSPRDAAPCVPPAPNSVKHSNSPEALEPQMKNNPKTLPHRIRSVYWERNQAGKHPGVDFFSSWQ